ncbi:MAG: peptidoglycan DD-metalloendopeptidase family protein [Polyangiales bacterium]|nr:M23 family metallopeptidase [Myxococcales bacterium]MCB9661817.1 M23 family metallopeptidase [Sandaracinaceae bacterium]
MTEKRDDTPLRPLPSVSTPLLRADVEAAERKRRMLVLVGAGALVAGVAAFILLRPPPADEPAEAPEVVPNYVAPEGLTWSPDGVPPPPEVVEVPTEQAPSTAVESDEAPLHAAATVRSEARFGRARAFRQALENAGLANEDFLAIEAAVREVLDFRRCRSDDRLYFERDGQGRLVRFEYHQSPEEFVVATRASDGTWSGRVQQREIERRRMELGGQVRTTLGEALTRIGLASSLVGVFVEVFDGKMNFSTGVREGDTLRVIVDEERIDGAFLRYSTPVAIEYVSARAGRLRAFYYEPRGQRADWYDEAGRGFRGGWLRTPLQYERISSLFDPQRLHPILRRIVPHNGVDFAAATGTTLWAAADGEITWAGPKGPNGNLVSIRHENGYESHYAHMHRIQRGITVGAQVTQRQVIGSVGTTGRSTGPHLHFGLKHHGRFVDPLPVLNGPGQLLPPGQLAGYRTWVRGIIRRLERIDTGGDPVVREAVPTSATASDEGLD